MVLGATACVFSWIRSEASSSSSSGVWVALTVLHLESQQAIEPSRSLTIRIRQSLFCIPTREKHTPNKIECFSQSMVCHVCPLSRSTRARPWAKSTARNSSTRQGGLPFRSRSRIKRSRRRRGRRGKPRRRCRWPTAARARRSRQSRSAARRGSGPPAPASADGSHLSNSRRKANSSGEPTPAAYPCRPD